MRPARIHVPAPHRARAAARSLAPRAPLALALALALAACSGGSVVPGDGGSTADTGPDIAATDVSDGAVDAGPRCEGAERECAGRCANVQSDPAHCGACGNACAPGMACVAGACAAVCATGETMCAGRCVNTVTDAANCGACGTACPAGQRCVRSRCEPTCGANETLCGGACVDTQTDRANCGACGAACCAGEICTGGRCSLGCPMGLTVCRPTGATCAICTSVATDSAHCGMCNNACPAGTACADGACRTVCPAGQSLCGALCANLQTDRGNCGACGTACAAGQVCASGRCVTECPAGQTACTAGPMPYCASTATDVANCGACGAACPARANATVACAMGRCGFACNAGFGDCDANEANGCEANFAATTDVRHCGACGVVCPARPNAAAACAMGRCGVACNAGFANCNAMDADGCEANLATSAAHCGACGNACGAGRGCVAGRCVPAGLVAHYSFNACDARDDSGNGNAGVPASTLRCMPGRMGNALFFPGSAPTDVVVVRAAPVLDALRGAALTVAGWVQHPDFGANDRHVWSLSEAGTNSYVVGVSSSTGPSILLVNDVSLIGDAPAIPNNVWVHVATTFDGTTWRFFQNGVLVRSAAGARVARGTCFVIGTDQDVECAGGPDLDEWVGLIDEVVVYNRALDAGDLSRLIASGP